MVQSSITPPPKAVSPPSLTPPATQPTNTASPQHTTKGLEPPRILLMGAPGTGKTYSLATLLKAGLEVFVMITEPNALESLLDACSSQKISTEKLHWKNLAPAAAEWSQLERLATLINTLDYEGVTKLKDVNKSDSKHLMALLKSLQNFVDDRTGQSYGDVTSWNYDRALVIDSLSGLNIMCQQACVGLKPTLAPGEWNIAMNTEEMLINKLTSDLKCFFILTAHIDRAQNEATLQSVITPAALGAKLGPKLGRFFSEVVLTKRTGADFKWSTQEASTETKQRALPISTSIEPSFVPVVNAYRSRIAKVV